MTSDALRRCVDDVERFRAEHWGRQPLVRRGAGPFDDLLDVDAIEEMLGLLARRPTFRLVQGAMIPPAQYTVRSRVGGADIDDVADVDRILDLVAGGATLVLQGLQRTWAPLAAFCRDLEGAIGHPVQANAYLSPPATAGLKRHHDRHDVFVLQVAGSKCWDIDGLGDVHLTAGDVVYLPSSTEHDARTTGASSLHITIGVLSVTRRAVLHRLVDRLPDLDRPLPLGLLDHDVLDDVVRELGATLETAAAAIGATPPADVARHELERRRRRVRPDRSGRLRTVVDPGALDQSTLLRRRSGTAVTVEQAPPDHVLLELSDRTLRFPALATAALAVVAARTELRVDELPDLDADSRLVLARRLVREGLLIVAPGTTPG